MVDGVPPKAAPSGAPTGQVVPGTLDQGRVQLGTTGASMLMNWGSRIAGSAPVGGMGGGTGGRGERGTVGHRRRRQ